ncbi:MAG: nucleotidyltransferase family protein [Acidobacteria bacterium]|nr:nucleotidyltransferase family protein [Acidobacteriota bacterium]
MKIRCLCYSFVVNDLNANRSADYLSDHERWLALQHALADRRAADAFTFFRSHGIEPILIKGPAAALMFPEGRFRYSTDIDLAFAEADFAAAKALFAAASHSGLPIDPHCGLRSFDSTPWDTLFGRSRLVEIGGTSIRVLTEEDHLRLLCVHWLIDGGWNKDRLWDIYYAVKNRAVDFDWNICLNSVSSKRRRWIICVIGLAHKYLGLELDGLPFADDAKNIPGWVFRAVEKEWRTVQIRPLSHFLNDPKMFIAQLRKRIPPNPLRSVVEMEGNIDTGIRLHYQIGLIFRRMGPGLFKIFRSARDKTKIL